MPAIQPFDLDAAKQAATKDTQMELQLALGNAGNSMDDILESLWNDTGLTAAQKTSAFQAIAANAAAIVQNAMSGSNGPASLGSSSQSTSSGISQQDYDDLKDEKDAAEAQNRELTKDRKALEQVADLLSLTKPANSNTPFPQDFAQRVDQAIKDKETAAAAAPSDMVKKTDVKDALNAVAAAEEDLETTRFSADIDGRQELKESIDAALQLVS